MGTAAAILLPMKMLLRWIISKFKKSPEEGSVVPEKWESGFRRKRDERFFSEQGEKHRVSVEKGFLRLSLEDYHLFAWALNSLYRYRNFVLDLSISFDANNGHSAAGAMFRYMSEENYYYALISKEGYFRFDVVFNANPITLIPWMKIDFPPLEEEPAEEIGAELDRHMLLRIIARETSFAFFVNGEWIAELDDEMIDTGYIAFAAQNYGEAERADFYLDKVILESRPMEVEILHERWVNYLDPDVDRRLTLARRLYGIEQYTAALIQLKKAFRSREPEPEERLFLAETLIQLHMYEEALKQVENCIEADSGLSGAKVEKANLLYLLNRFIETKRWIEEILEEFPGHAPLLNLLGNAEFSLGNWSDAARRYEEALVVEEEMPIFALNAARSHDYAEEYDRAVELYRRAAGAFFRQEAYEELLPIRSRMAELAPDDAYMRAVEGKLLFQEGKLTEAERLFRRNIEEAVAESEIFFLEGIVRMQIGSAVEAVDYLRRAVEMEPDFHLYRLRLAESLHLAGLPAQEELDRALALEEGDGWTCNLAGLLALEGKETEEARRYLERAYQELPEEREIQLNYSTALYRSYGLEKAEHVLTEMEDPYVLNHRANLYAEDERLEDAVNLYRRALEKLPEETAFLENMASALMNMRHFAEAEEYLVRLLDTGGEVSVKAYEMIAEVAKEKGEFERAATTLEEALKMDPENGRIRLTLGRLLCRRERWEQAREHLEELREREDFSGIDEVHELLHRIRAATETRYECSSCGREWWVPKEIEPPQRLRLYGEPPKESPAGRCDSCGRVYCIECAMEHMEGNRFICPHCDERLKLSDGGLRYLAVLYANREQEPS